MFNTNNVCFFEGRISKDPEFTVVSTGNGNSFSKCTFDIAVDRSMSSAQKQTAQQNNQPTADFIHCVATGSTADTMKQWCPKGKAVKVFCHITQYTYTDKTSGQTRYGYQFDVDHLGFTTSDSKTLGDNNQQNNQQNYQQNNYQQNYQNNQQNYQQQNYQNNQQNNYMNAPQPQNNFQIFDNSNSASPF